MRKRYTRAAHTEETLREYQIQDYLEKAETRIKEFYDFPVRELLEKDIEKYEYHGAKEDRQLKNLKKRIYDMFEEVLDSIRKLKDFVSSPGGNRVSPEYERLYSKTLDTLEDFSDGAEFAKYLDEYLTVLYTRFMGDRTTFDESDVKRVIFLTKKLEIFVTTSHLANVLESLDKIRSSSSKYLYRYTLWVVEGLILQFVKSKRNTLEKVVEDSISCLKSLDNIIRRG